MLVPVWETCPVGAVDGIRGDVVTAVMVGDPAPKLPNAGLELVS